MESIESFPFKEILTAAGPLIKGVADTFIVPKLEQIKKRFSLDVKKYYVPTEEHFTEYFYRTYKRLSVINTLVFNNSQKLLKEIYLPLTITLAQNKDIKYKIDGYPESIIKKYQKVLITDTAGMGKSTLMKRIFIDIIDSKKGIPVLIELRRLSKDKTILNEIHEQLNAVNKDFDEPLLCELISQGGFIFILDGYDEISLGDREIVTKDMQSFIEKAPNNYLFLTSRPESALKSFGDFQEFSIEPLKKKEAFELLRKYDRQGSISSLLIKKLEEVELSNIEEFLTNPLLVSLLFTAFEHKQVIPFKKHIFYRQVYDANFESHDLTKGDSYMHAKYSSLDIDDFHRILRYIGFKCLKLQKIEFTKDELLQIINDAKVFCIGLKFTASDFLKDLLINVPLFSQDGIYYRWAHKSLQEYFAAQFIYLDAKDQQKKILEKIYYNPNVDKFINLLDLYYDIDFRTFRNVFVRELVNEYFLHAEKVYNHNYPEVNTKDLIKRKELTFLDQPLIFKASAPNEKQSFEEGRFNLMLEELNTNQQLDPKGFSGVIIGATNNQDLYCIHYNSEKVKLYPMLFRKKNKLISKFQERTKKPEIIELTVNIKDEYHPEFISDNPTSQFNNASNFKYVNRILEISNLWSYKINHSVALELKKEIDNDLAIEMTQGFLLDGI